MILNYLKVVFYLKLIPYMNHTIIFIPILINLIGILSTIFQIFYHQILKSLFFKSIILIDLILFKPLIYYLIIILDFHNSLVNFHIILIYFKSPFYFFKANFNYMDYLIFLKPLLKLDNLFPFNFFELITYPFLFPLHFQVIILIL